MSFKTIILTGAATISLSLACALPAQAQSIPGQGTWEFTLLGRDINRNAVSASDASAVYLYDTTLDVTWLRDANANGVMSWDNATTWAANLNTGSGSNTISDWRLPSMTDTGTPGCDFSYNGTDCGYNPATSTSEIASLFFNTLGNKSYYNSSGAVQADFGLTNMGSFQNMQSYAYWLGQEVIAPLSNSAWHFYINYGSQGGALKNLFQLNALAVRPGDVLISAVPEPETYVMLLAGLGLMVTMARRRK